MKKLAFGFVVAAAVSSAAAQNNPAVTQADTVRQERQIKDAVGDLGRGDKVPSLYSEEELDIGPQSILRKRKHRWLRASVDSQVFYTDNMFFLKDSDIDAGVAVTTGEAALMTPPCITRWASYRAEVGYRHQFFNYFGKDQPIVAFTPLRREDFDFDSSTAFADVLAQTRHYQFRAGFDFARLLGTEGLEPLRQDGEEFYREYVPRWSLQRNFRICDRSQFSLAYLGAYHFTEEDPVFAFIPGGGVQQGFEDRSSRWEHAAIAAFSVALPWDLVAQPYYRFQHTRFDSLPVREVTEFLHTTGFGLGWYPCENFSARVFANYNWAVSDSVPREYEQLNVGGGLNLTFWF